MTKNIFHQDHYQSVREPHPHGGTLPSWCYTSEEFHAKEVENIFEKEWLFLGREDQLPKPGDYKVIERFSRSIILMRGTDSVIRALANFCRHRSSLLLDEDSNGNCKKIKCRYHAWAYGDDGKLNSAPGMEQAPDFDKSDYPLIEYRLESWGGFLFINFQKTGPSLLESLGGLPNHLESYPLEEMVTVKTERYEVECNWKLSMEIALDSFHAIIVHADSIDRQFYDVDEIGDNWLIQYYKTPKTIALAAGSTSEGFPHIKSLKGRLADGTSFVMLCPSVYLIFVQDCCWWLHKIPVSAKKSILEVGFCFPKETIELDGFEQLFQEYSQRWDRVVMEDNDAVELQQKGLNNIDSVPGRYLAKYEKGLHIFNNWILDKTLSADNSADKTK